MNAPRPMPILLVSLALATAMASALPDRAEAGEVAIDGKALTIRDGFQVERIAGPPLVDRPITGDFDEQGAFYVADSSGSNEPLAKQVLDPTHRIVKLVDDDGDGRFDRRTVFADRMMFPEGTLWHEGSLYVSAPPSIWKLTDTDGDGVADVRVEWFQGKTLTGCGNDLHGPYLGHDGWIYWAKGAFAEQTYPRPGRKPLVTRASHLFRARPDGSGIEPVMTGGMDNPVDIAFSAGGERFFTTTFLQIPGGGKRDGIIHAIYGGVYGKENAVIDDHPRTMPGLMPVMTHLGAAAPSGLACFESSTFGDEFRGNLIACQFNRQRVSRHVLVPDGATFRTEDEDFLSSADHDFHPTDTLEDADGSLVVIDTGGWYKLCCPTSQLEKPDVLGGIYRIRKAGAPRPDDPRGLRLAWDAPPDDLAVRLGDPRPAVRRRSIQALAKIGPVAVPALDRAIREGDPESRRNAIWAASRIDGPEARAATRLGLRDADETNRQAAIHATSVRPDREAIPALIEILDKPSRQNARAAAESLGRQADPSIIPAILAAIGTNSDPMVEHSLIYAVIEMGDAGRTRLGLGSPSEAVRRAAIVALDQMDEGGLTPDRVAPMLASNDPRTKDTAAWIMSRHADWGNALAGVLRQRWDSPDLTESDRGDLERQLARFAGSATIQGLLAETLADPRGKNEAKLGAARAMAQSTLKAVPPSWTEALAKAVTSGDPALRRAAVDAARALPWKRDAAGALLRSLLALADDRTAPDPLRLSALAAVPGGLAPVAPGAFAFLIEHVHPDRPAPERSTAADVLSRARLNGAQFGELAGAIRTASPLEIDRLVLAFEKTTDDVAGLALLDALKNSASRSSIRVGTIRPILAKYGKEVRERADAFYESLSVDEAKQRAKLQDLLPRIAGGDVRRGQAVFNGSKAACTSCHAIGYLGGKLGPDLSKIGQIRGDRDLLEAIVFPSASFVRSYEPVVIATESGQVHSGIVARETADEVTLKVDADHEVRVPRAEIEEMRPGDVSVMPAGLDERLTVEELADLIAFLKTRR